LEDDENEEEYKDRSKSHKHSNIGRFYENRKGRSLKKKSLDSREDGNTSKDNDGYASNEDN